LLAAVRFFATSCKYRILDPQKFDFVPFHRSAVKFLSAQDDT
jgi:hypothetical protein